ncbi:phage antirepressor [Lachnoclostridium sp.]|uniref:phage antirepressor n=1 Tax=Lachnoclostridium sp. TaxID=2028282 RepID=UPI002897F7DA|nr:phage antirepressor [Lachnoclostridium sp.]
MEQLKVFENPEFGQVRTVTINNEPYFVGTDVATILGYAKTQNAIATHIDKDDALKQGITDSLGRLQETTVINESGLYALILGSKLENAKRFKKWLTSEVLPSIRKHGMYATDELINNPDLLIAVATQLKEERQARVQAEQKIIEMKPKAEFFDTVADSKDAIEIGQVAKLIGSIGRNRLFELLRDKRVLMNNNQPYQKYIDNGYFRVVEQKYTKPNGDTCINIKTLVYQRGVDYIRKLIA